MIYCEQCREEIATHRIEVLRRRFVNLCGSCHLEATDFKILPIDQIKCLPNDDEAGGVYFLWDGDSLQYIGQSFEIGNRVTQHSQAYMYGESRARTTKRIKFDKVTCLAMDRRAYMSADESSKLRNRLLIIERAYIEAYRPPFNNEWFL